METKLTLQEYHRLANITLAPDTPEMQIEHCYLGYMTELGEAIDVIKRHRHYKKNGVRQPFNVVTFLEELGDIVWYTHIPFKVFDATAEQVVVPVNCQHTLLRQLTKAQLVVVAATYAEILRAGRTIHGDVKGGYTVGHHAISDANHVLRTVHTICEQLDVDISDIFAANIAKLAKRYPQEQFDQLPAFIRDLSTERSTLESFLGKYEEPVREKLKGLV